MTPDTQTAPVEAPDPADVYAEEPQSPQRRRRTLVVMLALLALVVVAGLAWAFTRGDDPDPVAEAPPASGEMDMDAPSAGGLAQYDLNGDGILDLCEGHLGILPGQEALDVFHGRSKAGRL